MRLGLSIACLLAVTVLVPASHATTASLSCGAVVTKDVTLTKSLTGCASGLIVGADNVTIDLNGHSIRGLGTEAGIGIEGFNRTGVRLKNGTISDFAQGVQLLNTSSSTIERIVIRRTVTGIWVSPTDNHAHSIRILNNSVRDSRDGIFFAGAVSSRIAGNTLSRLSGIGILCRNTVSADLRIEGNRSVKNNIGIQLLFCEASVADNVASDNAIVGIVRTRSNGLTVRNVANENGQIGIVTDDSHGLILENVANRNSGDGLLIVDSSPDHGPFHTVTGNTANKNGGLGITTNLVGVIDGGGNRARHNGNPLECQGVACT
jgi:nitrous oxidase accessory protein NosD